MTEEMFTSRYPELLRSRKEEFTALSRRVKGTVDNPPNYSISCVAYLPNNPNQSRFPTVIASSGLWCTRNHWAVLDIANTLLPHGIATVTYDHAGLNDPTIGGQSDGTADAYSIGQMRQDVRAVITKTGNFPWADTSNMFGVGTSIGGWAQIWERNLPNSPPLKSTILLSPAPHITDWYNYFYPKTTIKVAADTTTFSLQRARAKPPKGVAMNIFHDSEQDGFGILNSALLAPGEQKIIIVSAEKDEQINVFELWNSLTGKHEFSFNAEGLAKAPVTQIGTATIMKPTTTMYVVAGADHDFTRQRNIVHRILLDQIKFA